jgi:uncharacterized protein (TIGR02145 family)
MCNIYGALYTWETAMMVDGKYADETKTSSAWDESWVSPYYYATGAPATNPNADRNNGRGGMTAKGGGRGICPKGWHVPTDFEWAALMDKVDGDGTGTVFTEQSFPDGWKGIDVGLKLRSAATYSGSDPGNGSWYESGAQATDDYDFCVLSGGFVHEYERLYMNRGTYSGLLTSSVNAEVCMCIGFSINFTGVYKGIVGRFGGVSVRCVSDL